MEACAVNTCKLPTWFDTAALDDQVALMLNCTIANAAQARECQARHQCLADWVGK